LENHKIWSRVLLVLFLVSLLGGLGSSVEKCVEVVKLFFKEDAEFRIKLEVQNVRSNPVEISPVCNFEVIESGVNSVAFYSGLGDRVRLVPFDSKGTNNYRLNAGEVRRYSVRLPNNQEARDLIDRGATTIKFFVLPLDGNAAEGVITFQKDIIRRDKAVIKIK
jgi:hypothetical protein